MSDVLWTSLGSRMPSPFVSTPAWTKVPPKAHVEPAASDVWLTSAVAPASPGTPCGPVGPVMPVAPAGPCAPVAPVVPCGPVEPVAPVAPVAPVTPVGPCGPAGPCGPVAPCGPAGPCGPVAPGSVICVHCAAPPLGFAVQAQSEFAALSNATSPPVTPAHATTTQPPTVHVSSVSVEVTIAVSPSVFDVQAGSVDELPARICTLYTPFDAPGFDGFADGAGACPSPQPLPTMTTTLATATQPKLARYAMNGSPQRARCPRALTGPVYDGGAATGKPWSFVRWEPLRSFESPMGVALQKSCCASTCRVLQRIPRNYNDSNLKPLAPCRVPRQMHFDSDVNRSARGLAVGIEGRPHRPVGGAVTGRSGSGTSRRTRRASLSRKQAVAAGTQGALMVRMARHLSFAVGLAVVVSLARAATGCSSASESATGKSEASTAPSTCQWPASLNDAGPGACSVGRAYVKCTYPSGVNCEAGGGASSPEGLTMLCISDDPTSCSGCGSTAGAATCTDMCAPNEYALSCGGPPHFNPDGGVDNFTYEQPPANCVGMGGTPAGNGYYCCPCE